MNVVDALASALGPQTVNQLGSQLGMNPETAQRSLQAALPALLGALQRNASQPGGAESLHHAVVRDHADADPMARLMGMLGGQGGAAGALAGMLGGQGGAGGGLGGLLGGMLGGGGAAPQAGGDRATNGAAILGHVLGSRQPRVEQGVAQAAGINAGQAAQLMAMLAPMVMAALGKMTRSDGLDADGLASALGQQTREVGVAAGQGGVLASLLDADGDGKVDAADLLKHGSSILGAFMRR